jgi:hypothetical protein
MPCLIAIINGEFRYYSISKYLSLFIWIDNDTLGSANARALLVAPGAHAILATRWMLLPWVL